MFWNPYIQVSTKEHNTLAISSLVTCLVLWFGLPYAGFDVPSPIDVVMALYRLSWDPITKESLLLTATLYSTARVIIAGLLVVAVGVPFGILLGAAPKVDAFMSPFIDPLRSAPVAAFLPVLVMWLGIGELMKITFLFIGAVVYIIPMVRNAVKAVPQSYWISAYDLGATPFEAVTKSVVPMAKPGIADAVTVAVSIMWTYITVAEYVNAERGLGQLIQNARRFSAMDQVFAGIFVIIALALVTYKAMTLAKNKLYPWEIV